MEENMGAWGTDTFDNDTACDFAAEIAGTRNLAKLEATVDRVLQMGDAYLEAPDAEEGLAAADIIARLNGNFGVRNAYTETIDAWVAQFNLSPSGALVEKARRVVARVLTEPSELLELWNESDEANKWRLSVEALRTRL
jgi:hypothetical protein